MNTFIVLLSLISVGANAGHHSNYYSNSNYDLYRRNGYVTKYLGPPAHGVPSLYPSPGLYPNYQLGFYPQPVYQQQNMEVIIILKSSH